MTTVSSLSFAKANSTKVQKLRNSNIINPNHSIKTPRQDCSIKYDLQNQQVSKGVENVQANLTITGRIRTKRVNFSAAQPQVLEFVKPSSIMTEEEKKDIYWQPSDYEYFRGTAQILARQIRRLSLEEDDNNKKSYSNTMTRIYEISHMLSSYPISSDDESQSNLVPSRDLKLLSEWTKLSHARRGLEKWAVESHARNRPYARVIHNQSVLTAQEVLRRRHQMDHSQISREEKRDESTIFVKPKETQDALYLCEISEKYSRHARLFAEIMGSADAAAICKPCINITRSQN